MHCLRFSHFPPSPSLANDNFPFLWLPPTPFAHPRRIGEELTLVFVPPHPLMKHWLSILRNVSTPASVFRNALAELGRFLIYEASREWLLTIKDEVQTPCGIADVEFVDPQEPIVVIPILRAGLVLVEHVASVLPAAQTYHIGFIRDRETIQPIYFNKLPDEFPSRARVLIADAMLASGDTLVSIIELLKQRNVDYRLIRIVSAAAAPPALDMLSKKFPGIRIYAASVDEVVSESGDIMPHFGDAGDRSYGT